MYRNVTSSQIKRYFLAGAIIGGILSNTETAVKQRIVSAHVEQHKMYSLDRRKPQIWSHAGEQVQRDPLIGNEGLQIVGAQ